MCKIAFSFGQGKQTEKAEKEAGEMKRTINMTDWGVDSQRKDNWFRRKGGGSATCCKKHPTWNGIQFHLSSGFIAIWLRIYLHAFSCISFSLPILKCLLWLSVGWCVRCHFNFKKLLFLFIQDGKQTLPPRIQKIKVHWNIFFQTTSTADWF